MVRQAHPRSREMDYRHNHSRTTGVAADYGAGYAVCPLRPSEGSFGGLIRGMAQYT